MSNRLTLKINSKPGAKDPEPLKIPRPGVTEEKKRPATAAEMARAFAGHVKVKKKEQ